MTFKMYDFDAMRDWLKSIPGDVRIRRARLICFDLKRYTENYDALYQYIEFMGGEIDYDNYT